MPTLTPCPSVASLKQLLIGQLGDEEAEPLAAHLDACPDCAAALAALSADDTLADALRATASETPQPPSERLHAVMERLRQQSRATTTDAPAGSEEAPELTFLAPPQGPDELGRLGGYRVLRLLGAGGMGLVFEAEDEQLRRRVALKVMRPEIARKSTARSRFLREARLAAALDHDHVVHIYHVGEDRGVPFLAMQFLEGMSLDALLKQGSRLQLVHVLRIGRQIASGLAAAHDRGLIHRDIKPGNIWIEKEHDGRVKLLDFGLARSAETGEPLTQSGAIVGTPAYMAPEQARGETVDARADLFSLGCVLYELATGRRPFTGSNPMAILNSLALDTPAAPRQVDTAVPAALSELVMQLLEKDPAKRPASARDVAEALMRIELVPASGGVDPRRPPDRDKPGRSPRMRRAGWLVAAAVLFLLGGGVLLQQIIIRIKDKEGNTIAEMKVGKDQNIEIEKDGKVVPLPDKQPPKVPDATPKIGEDRPLTAFDALRREDIPPYELKVAGGGDPKQAPAELVTIIGDSRLKHSSYKFWSVAFSADGKLLASASDDSVKVWDTSTGENLLTLETTWRPGEYEWIKVAFSPDGKTLVTADVNYAWSDKNSFLVQWELSTGRRLGGLPGRWCVAFSPDGKLLASGGDEAAVLLDAATGKELRRLKVGVVRAVAFSKDSNTLATGNNSGTIKLWDVNTGEERLSIKTPANPGGNSTVSSLAFSADGKSLASTGSNDVRVWDVGTGKELRNLNGESYPQGHASPFPSVAFGPDGRLHLGETFSRDGKMIASVGNGRVSLRDSATGQEKIKLRGHRGDVTTMAISPDGKTLATAGNDGTVMIWDVATGKELQALKGHSAATGSPGVSLAFSPDSKILATSQAHPDHKTKLWDVANGQQLREIGGFSGGAGIVAFSPDGQIFAIAGGSGSQGHISLWHVGTWARLGAATQAHVDGVMALALSPDGKTLASWGTSQNQADPVRLWDVSTQKEIRTFRGSSPSFSPDGKLLVYATADGWKLLDLATGEGVRTLNTQPVFSPDGKLLASLIGDGKVRLWDFDSRSGGLLERKTFQAVPSGMPTRGLWFSPDGRHLLTLNGNGTIYVFRLAPHP
jgi:WD40 repeat protein/serine/threonine protein kinase